MKGKVPTPKPPAPEPQDATKGYDLSTGWAIVLIAGILIYVLGIIVLKVFGLIQRGGDMPASEMKHDIHMKDVTKRLTLVVNLKGYKVWLFRKTLATVCLRIVAWLLGVKYEREE